MPGFDPSTCCIPKCDRPKWARGWCGTHYRRWARTGDPEGVRKLVIPGGLWNRVWERVDVQGPDSCWPFMGSRSRAGYGQVGDNHRIVYTHRLVCEWAWGRPPTSSHEVLHACDNPPCVNPFHLRWGTRRDNVHDMIMKGRNRWGAVR